MEFGFSLHPKWLGSGTREEFLGPLKSAGLSVLEFTLHPAADEWPAMRALAVECVAAGYHCHFHAPYQAPYAVAGFARVAGFATTRREEIQRSYAPALEFVEQMARAQAYDPALIIHGATADAPRAELRRDTEAFLAWVLESTRHARLMFEILPPKPPLTRTGESRDEVLEVVRTLNAPRVGLCWDLGHDYLLGYSDLPKDEFLRAVRHVHIHDVNAERADHFPLIYGNVPWEADLRALAAAGFDGAVIMEVNGQRARAVDRLSERLIESFARMKAIAAEREGA